MVNAANSAAAIKVGRRTNLRVRLRIPAELILLNDNRRCILDDLSRCGARLTISPPPETGSNAILKCADLDVFGTVLWTRAGQCGLRFDRHLRQEVVVRMRSFGDGFPEYEHLRQEGRVRDWVEGKASIF